jgi:hypothetical protein
METLFGVINNVKKNLQTTKGSIDFENGNIYVGEICNGAMNGRGNMMYTNGDVFTGTFCNNVIRGYGKLLSKTIYGTFITYEGVFDDVEFYGCITYENGDVYCGSATAIPSAYLSKDGTICGTILSYVIYDNTTNTYIPV